MSVHAAMFCDDCHICLECERKFCDPRPMCEHGTTCDPCFPGSCEPCIEALERDELL